MIIHVPACDKGFKTNQIICNTCEMKAVYKSHNPFTGEGFRENVLKAENDGWMVFKDGGEWKHYCPACNFDATPNQKREFKILTAFQKSNK